ncbi:hypothetical protein NMB32_17720 [Stenotrophomonas sp. CD2]|nr:hypothetical protein NMB32_17720 [Stenotrophomonas sp. CD2]
MYKQFFMAALCAAGLAAAGCSKPDGDAAGTSARSSEGAPVRISVGSYNLNNLPFFIADAKGYFKDVGLEVKTENFAGVAPRCCRHSWPTPPTWRSASTTTPSRCRPRARTWSPSCCSRATPAW